MVSAGIDMGSKTIKVVVMKDGRLCASAMCSGGFEQREAAWGLYVDTLSGAGLKPEMVGHLVATGMGRAAADFADSKVTDITAAARAAAFYFPGASMVIEIGAEESRAIKTDGQGKVLDSAVNEKCAAGSGSFTESMARALGMNLEEFARESLLSTEAVPVNAQCTVFAESEVVSLVHRNVAKRDIARAIHDAMAGRVASMARRIKLEGQVVLFGGLAQNAGFRKSLMEKLELSELKIPEMPQYADAVGAALIAAERG